MTGKASKAERVGRKPGSHNKGYWFRKGRGWYLTSDGNPLPLRDESGTHIKAQDTPAELLQSAWIRHCSQRQEQTKKEANRDLTTIAEVSRLYLSHCKANNSPSTYRSRAWFLFNLVTGFPGRFRDKGNGTVMVKPAEKDRIHAGYGDLTISDFLPLHVENWLASNPGWKGDTKRMAVQSIKGALNYYAKATGGRASNPIKGFPVKTRSRLTYFDDSQEQAFYKHAKEPLALAIKILIRTGARYGSEFCQLTARHVEETAKGQIWRFAPGEHKTGGKTGTPRLIYVPPEIAEIVRGLIKLYPHGERLFRNTKGKPWTPKSLRTSFERLLKKLENSGMKFDKDAVLYTTRHTFAKRCLCGYYTGKPQTLEYVAKLMGTTRQVCEKYADWCPAYSDPLWDAIG